MCGKLSEWSPWSQCSVTCGAGEASRERICSNKAQILPQAACLTENLRERRECVKNSCSDWTAWGSWRIAPASWTLERHRKCEPENFGCEGDAFETKPCNATVCPIFTDWSEWEPIGSRMLRRVRSCKNGNLGDQGCLEKSEELKLCPENCSAFSHWSDWRKNETSARVNPQMWIWYFIIFNFIRFFKLLLIAQKSRLFENVL